MYNEMYALFYDWLASASYTTTYGESIVDELCNLLTIATVAAFIGIIIGLLVFMFRFISSLALRR